MKNVKGRKRRIAVDTDGPLLTVNLTTGDYCSQLDRRDLWRVCSARQTVQC